MSGEWNTLVHSQSNLEETQSNKDIVKNATCLNLDLLSAFNVNLVVYNVFTEYLIFSWCTLDTPYHMFIEILRYIYGNIRGAIAWLSRDMQYKHSPRWWEWKFDTSICSVQFPWKWLCQRKATSGQTNGFVCHFVSLWKKNNKKKLYFWFAALQWLEKWEKRVGVCRWQDRRKSHHAGCRSKCPSNHVFVSLAPHPIRPRGLWWETVEEASLPLPSLKIYFSGLLGIYDMQSVWTWAREKPPDFSFAYFF